MPPTFPLTRTVSATSVREAPEREGSATSDGSWGHRSAVSTRRGGGYDGHKIHAAVCASARLPLAWQIETARRQESNFVAPLIDSVHARGFNPEACAMDKGYDNNRVYAECEERGARRRDDARMTRAGAQSSA